MSNTISIKEYQAMLNKEKVKKGTPEHDQQVKVFEWANIMSAKTPLLKLLMAIPNGAYYGGHWSVANKMKSEGVKSGVPDIFLPVIRKTVDGIDGGLWIEMKSGKNKPTPQQEWWMLNLQNCGYQVRVCYSAEEAIDEIADYLNFEDN